MATATRRRKAGRPMSPAMIDAQAKDLRAFAAPLRLRILALLARRGEMYHSQIAEELGLATDYSSQALGVLVRAGLLAARKDGNRVYYGLVPGRVAEMVGRLEKLLGVER